VQIRKVRGKKPLKLSTEVRVFTPERSGSGVAADPTSIRTGVWNLSQAPDMVEQMFGSDTTTTDTKAGRGTVLASDFPGMTVAEWDAEERLIWELTDAGIESARADEAVVLPADLDSWAADLRLAAVLAVVDVNQLSGSDRVIYMKAQHRLNTAGQARFLGSITAVSDAYDELSEDIEDPNAGASMEIRAALRWTRRATDNEMALAHDLQVRLPGLFARFAEGMVDRRRAERFSQYTSHLSTAHARQVVDSLLDDAPKWTTGQLIERIRAACLDVDPDTARERFEESRNERRVVSWSDPDGTITLSGSGLDPVKVAEAKNRIDCLARDLRTGRETRSMDQLRADIFLELLTGSSDLPRTGSVHLTVDLATLSELKGLAGDLAGYGPVTADISRQLTRQLGDTVWDWTVVHPETGMPIGDGTTRRRPSASQIRKVRTKNRTCVAPGCRNPVIDCDIDHTKTWAETGITNSEDLAALCRHDHCIRHQTGWTYQRLGNGDYLWTGPLGGPGYTTSGNDPP
jgi:hypothetical protein